MSYAHRLNRGKARRSVRTLLLALVTALSVNRHVSSLRREPSDLVRRRNDMRKLIIVVGSGLLIATACSSDPAISDDTAPVVSVDVQAELTVTAISAACGDLCIDQPLYVRDQLVNSDTLIGEEDPMPEATSEAISDAYPDVTWVDLAAADAILEEVDGAQAVLVAVSSMTELAPGVQGVDVGITHGAFHGQTIQFRWNGTEWVKADSDDTGVTVTSVVS